MTVTSWTSLPFQKGSFHPDPSGIFYPAEHVNIMKGLELEKVFDLDGQGIGFNWTIKNWKGSSNILRMRIVIKRLARSATIVKTFLKGGRS